MRELLRGEHLFSGYGKADVLRDVSFSLRTGELCAVLGENGSGKSTLLRTVCGLLPFRGSLTMEGISLPSMSRRELARRIGYLSQRSGVSMPLRTADVVLMGFNPVLGLLQAPRAEHRRRALEALKQVGGDGLAEYDFQTLSEGQKQLVLLARTLVRNPGLLVLDEPDSALDLRHRQRFLRLLQELRDRSEQGVLLCSHDVNAALSWADRLLLLQGGRLKYDISMSCVSLDALQNALREIYGPVEVLQNKGRYFITGVDDS